MSQPAAEGQNRLSRQPRGRRHLIVKRDNADWRSQPGRRFDNTLHRHRVPGLPRIDSILRDSQDAERRPCTALSVGDPKAPRTASQLSRKQNFTPTAFDDDSPRGHPAEVGGRRPAQLSSCGKLSLSLYARSSGRDFSFPPRSDLASHLENRLVIVRRRCRRRLRSLALFRRLGPPRWL